MLFRIGKGQDRKSRRIHTRTELAAPYVEPGSNCHSWISLVPFGGHTASLDRGCCAALNVMKRIISDKRNTWPLVNFPVLIVVSDHLDARAAYVEAKNAIGWSPKGLCSWCCWSWRRCCSLDGNDEGGWIQAGWYKLLRYWVLNCWLLQKRARSQAILLF